MISDVNGAWSLDPQLAADTVAVGELPLSRVLLQDDANYPWLILAPRRTGAVELTDLDTDARLRLMDEIALTAAALRGVTGCDKLNVATLGNVVAQLHVHVIARFRTDAAWPAPVWGKVPRRAYTADERTARVAAMRRALGF